MTVANDWVRERIQAVEIAGVIVRIISFSVVSWLGPASPFLLVWTVNTVDAVVLTWCSSIKRDPAYLLMNVFWVLVGVGVDLGARGIIPE
jgi:hypothetical protein